MKIKKKKIRVQFDKYAADFLPERLRPIVDFCKQGEGYILKTGSQELDPAPILSQKKISAILTPFLVNSAPSFPPDVLLALFPQLPDGSKFKQLIYPNTSNASSLEWFEGKPGY